MITVLDLVFMVLAIAIILSIREDVLKKMIAEREADIFYEPEIRRAHDFRTQMETYIKKGEYWIHIQPNRQLVHLRGGRGDLDDKVICSCSIAALQATPFICEKYFVTELNRQYDITAQSVVMS